MNVAVFDTHVKKPDGSVAHFDIIVPQDRHTLDEILDFGRAYLTDIQLEGGELTSRECRFCHVETATPDMLASIAERGYFILRMADLPGGL